MAGTVLTTGDVLPKLKTAKNSRFSFFGADTKRLIFEKPLNLAVLAFIGVAAP